MLIRKPRKNDRITWPASSPENIWTVTEVHEDGICWLRLDDGPSTQTSRSTCFIWQFKDGLNKLAQIVEDGPPCAHVDFDEWQDGHMKCRSCRLEADTCPDCGEVGANHRPDCLAIAEEIRRQEDAAYALEITHETAGGPKTEARPLEVLEERPDAVRVEQGWIDRAFVTETTKPTLGQNPAEAQRMLYAGRQDISLKEGRVFDSERLATSPLFDRRLFE